jgi:acetoin utilization deacetylase AcuC-like enzyme
VSDVGEGAGRGFTINVPLLGSSGDAEYLAALERVILPIATAFAPDFLVISAGFDASARDPLGQMLLSDDAFGWMAASLITAALPSTQGRALMVLEGGYDLLGLELGLRAALDGFTLARTGFTMPTSRSDATIDRCVRKLKPYWPELR